MKEELKEHVKLLNELCDKASENIAKLEVEFVELGIGIEVKLENGVGFAKMNQKWRIHKDNVSWQSVPRIDRLIINSSLDELQGIIINEIAKLLEGPNAR